MKEISYAEYQAIIQLYPLWKELNQKVKMLYPRGINFHEAFSELIVCYINGYYHSLGKGSEDAFTKENVKVQIKATSNFNSDLTSFGPTSEFEILEFARLDQNTDILYLYRIPIEELYNLPVNKSETFLEQQQANRRPRFSVISAFIDKYGLNPYACVNMKTGQFQFFY